MQVKICVHTTANTTQPIAITVPHKRHLRTSLPYEDLHAPLVMLCANVKLDALVLRSCNAAGKKTRFKGIETVVLTSEERPGSSSEDPAEKNVRFGDQGASHARACCCSNDSTNSTCI